MAFSSFQRVMTNGDAIVDSDSVAVIGHEIAGYTSPIQISIQITLPISSKPIAPKG